MTLPNHTLPTTIPALSSLFFKFCDGARIEGAGTKVDTLLKNSQVYFNAYAPVLWVSKGNQDEEGRDS